MEEKTCEVCGIGNCELRRGRCWGCYQRWVESRPVGVGAACAVCNERRRGYLKQVELLRAWVPLCFNCAGRAMSLSPMPRTLDEIRRRLSRDRRAVERRGGKKDSRVYPHERRGIERRVAGHGPVDDLPELEHLEIELSEDELEPLTEEETKIIAMPTFGKRPRPQSSF
jgi:hypothetical protein